MNYVIFRKFLTNHDCQFLTSVLDIPTEGETTMKHFLTKIKKAFRYFFIKQGLVKPTIQEIREIYKFPHDVPKRKLEPIWPQRHIEKLETGFINNRRTR